MGGAIAGGRRPGRRKWTWIVAGSVILGGLLLVRLLNADDPLHKAYFYEPWQGSSKAYQAAYATWSTRPFDGYHLVLQYQITRLDTRSSEVPGFVTATCEVEVNVADRTERQIQVVCDSCGVGAVAPHSIAQVFALFREHAIQPIGKAPPLGQDGCYLVDAGYLDLVDGRYDGKLGYPHQIGNMPQLWIPDNCGSTILSFPTERDSLKRVRVNVTELTPLD
jgi:hypothetical protein